MSVQPYTPIPTVVECSKVENNSSRINKKIGYKLLGMTAIELSLCTVAVTMFSKLSEFREQSSKSCGEYQTCVKLLSESACSPTQCINDDENESGAIALISSITIIMIFVLGCTFKIIEKDMKKTQPQPFLDKV